MTDTVVTHIPVYQLRLHCMIQVTMSVALDLNNSHDACDAAYQVIAKRFDSNICLFAAAVNYFPITNNASKLEAPTARLSLHLVLLAP